MKPVRVHEEKLITVETLKKNPKGGSVYTVSESQEKNSFDLDMIGEARGLAKNSRRETWCERQYRTRKMKSGGGTQRGNHARGWPG